MARLLRTFDAWADASGLNGLPAAEPYEATRLNTRHRLSLDLKRGEIRTVIWATGFRPDFNWLDLPVFDAKGRLTHNAGIVARGLYVLGQPFQRTRRSALLDGVGADAVALADHLFQNSGQLKPESR